MNVAMDREGLKIMILSNSKSVESVCLRIDMEFVIYWVLDGGMIHGAHAEVIRSERRIFQRTTIM